MDHSATEPFKGGSLTCICCHLFFKTAKEQRDHYKSELHHFNLRRKVAELPPLTPEVFEEKAKNLKNLELESERFECQPCQYTSN
jgi:pre-60S factor REI1